MTFPETSTERAELENFADAIKARRPLAAAGGDEVHGVAVLEAILKSAKSKKTVKVAAVRKTAARKKTSAKKKTQRNRQKNRN